MFRLSDRNRLTVLAMLVLACGLSRASLAQSGTAWAWGGNQYGQVGDGTTTDRYVPAPLPGVSEIRAMAAGLWHTLALTSDGTVWSWGSNSYGQLGDGSHASRSVPGQVPGLTDVVAISAGHHSLAVRADGSVWVWGLNNTGQLGDRYTANRAVPYQLPGVSGVVGIAAGGNHSLALKGDGTLLAWGANSDGQLGDGSTTRRLSPVTVPGVLSVKTIAAGTRHSLAVLASGTVLAWGWNGFGQLGDGTTTPRTLPTPVHDVTDVVQVGAGEFYSVFRLVDGSVHVTGRSWHGGLDTSHPTRMAGLTDISSVAAGHWHCLAVESDGTVRAWGYGNNGRLGNNSNRDTNTPVKVAQVTGAVVVAGGGLHSLAATYGLTQTDRSVLIASPDAVLADGCAASSLVLCLTDPDGVTPISGRQIRFFTDRSAEDTLSSETAVTDADGEASITVRSSTPGVSNYTCRDETMGRDLPVSTQVTFTPPGGGPKFTVSATRGEGFAFLQHIRFDNRVEVTVQDWAGPIGKVRFDLNGDVTEVAAPSGTASVIYDMGTALLYTQDRDWSTLRITAINGDNQPSAPQDIHWMGVALPPSLAPALWVIGTTPNATISREDSVAFHLAVSLPHAAVKGASRVPAPLPFMGNTVWGSDAYRFEGAVDVELKWMRWPDRALNGTVRVAFGPEYERRWNKMGRKPKHKVSFNSFAVEVDLRPFVEFRFLPDLALNKLGLEAAFKAMIETTDLMPVIATAIPAAAPLVPIVDLFGRFVLPDASGEIAFADTGGSMALAESSLNLGVSGALVVSTDRVARKWVQLEAEAGLKPWMLLQYPGSDANASYFLGCHYLHQIGLDLFLRGHATFRLGFFETDVNVPELTAHFAYPAPAGKRGPAQRGSGVRHASWRPPFRAYLFSREPYHRLVARPARHPFQPWLDADFGQSRTRPLNGGLWDVAERELVQNVNNVASPALTYLDGMAVIAYVYDRPALPAHQSTEVRMLQETATGWTDVDVTNDTALDSQPSVMVTPEGKLVAVWTRMAGVVETDDPATRYTKGEIAWSVWDAVSETWSAPATITSDALLDLNPKLTMGRDGALYLTWLKSPDNVFPADFAAQHLPHTDLWMARWDGTGFVDAAPAISRVDTGEPVAFGVASSGERIAVWSKDRDGDEATDDLALYFSRYAAGTWSAPERVAPADVQPQSTPALTLTTADVPTLFYVRSGIPNVQYQDHTEENLVVSTLGGGVWSAPLLVARAGNMANLDVIATPDGKAAGMWTAASTEAADLWSTVFDPATMTYCNPVLLTKDQADERQLAAAWDPAGNPAAVYLKRRLEEQERQVEDDEGNLHPVNVLASIANDLYLLTHAPKPDLATTDADVTVTPPGAGPGEDTTLAATVRNLRALAASAVQVRFIDRTPDGDTVIATVTVDPAVLIGAGVGAATTTWTVPNDGKAHTVVAVVDADGAIVETDETNNEASYALLRPDLAAGEPYAKEYLPDGSVKIVLPIRNGSPVAFAAPVEWKLWLGDAGTGTLLGLGTASAPDPGQTQDVEVVRTPGGSTPSEPELTLVVDPDGKLADDDRSNNTASGVIALRPDLILNPYDGSFAWNPDGTGSVEVTLQNNGWCAAENVVVTVLSGPPDAPGSVSLGTTPVATLDRYGNTRLSITVGSSADLTEVYVIANPDGAIGEVRRDNNTIILSVPSRTPTSLWTIDRAGTITEIVILRQYDLKRTTDNMLLEGRTIAYKIDGTAVGTATTNAGGDSNLAWAITNGPATRTITTAFGGDATYSGCSDDATLTAESWTTKMVAFDRTARIAGKTELKARLLRSDNTPLYDKSVDFSVDGTFVITRPTNTQGYASYPYYTVPDGAGAGTRAIQANWPGNGGYLPSGATATLTVLKAIPYIWVMPRSVPQGGVARLYAYFRRLPDYQKQEGKTVTFRVDGTWVADVVTLSGAEAGIARYQYTSIEPPGAHIIRCEFAGDAWVDAGYGEASLTIY